MSISDINHQRVISEQRARISKLQQFVDRAGVAFIHTIPSMFQSMETADIARSTYNAAWFSEQPYSHDVKREMAAAFIDAASIYPTLTILDWESILAE